MRTELFKDIADRLKDQVPELKWIDMEWGQLEIPEESYPVQFDCALISFPDIPWEQLGLNVQEGLVQILIRIGVDLYSDTHTAELLSKIVRTVPVTIGRKLSGAKSRPTKLRRDKSSRRYCRDYQRSSELLRYSSGES